MRALTVIAALYRQPGPADALTGWLPHTTRAALTRLRQRGHALERTEANGRKAYRLAVAR